MRTKLTLVILGAAVLLLAATPAIMALVRTADDPLTTPSPFSWNLQLRGKLKRDINKAQYTALEKKSAVKVVVDENKPATADPADDTTYKGLTLKKLVGLIDDKNPKTFNKARAARGYGVEVTSVDLFSYTYASQDIAKWGKNVILANLANGKPLFWGKINSSGEFSPIWPLKVVCDGKNVVLTGKQRPSAVQRIRIVPAPTPSPSPSASVSPVAPF